MALEVKIKKKCSNFMLNVEFALQNWACSALPAAENQ